MGDQGASRRGFLRGCVAGAAGLAAGPQLAAMAQEPAGGRPPNILLIMSDEHNASVMGCAGDPHIHTPTLDRLAGRGVRFDNCYTNCPICVPSRASFTSGKYFSRCNVWNNFGMLPPAMVSLPRIMNAAGYESFLCGKMHYDDSCRYGFKELWWNMNPDFQTGEGERRKADDLTSGAGNYPNWQDDFGVAETSPVVRQGQRVTAGTLDFLAKRKPEDKPFFLLAGYEAPHYPLVIPKAYYEPYRDRIPMPSIPEGHIEQLALNYKHLRHVHRADTITPQMLKYLRELYYGMTQWVDSEMGKVLGALANSPFADNTVVIYTSDHGECMGEHGMLWKSCMFEQSARVPLIVSYPKRWKGGQQRKGACSLLDVVRTVTDLGGAKAPGDWDGTPLTGWLDDPAAKWKDLAIGEYYAQHIASGFVMIRTGKWKYVYHVAPDATHGPQRELYDLEADPGEFANLAGRPEHKDLIAHLHAAMIKEVGEDPEKTEQRSRADMARTYHRKKPPEATSRPHSEGD